MSALSAFAGAWHRLYPWHVALAATILYAVLYLLARVQLERATEDWANAYFGSGYSTTGGEHGGPGRSGTGQGESGLATLGTSERK